MMVQQMYDLFLSYTRKDLTVVQMLASELVDAGILVWFDQWALVPGRGDQSLEQEVQRSRAIGVCIGPRPTGELSEEDERMASFVQHLAPSSIIIPILLPKAKLTSIPPLLEGRVFVDFRDGVENELAIGKLASIISGDTEADHFPIEMALGDECKANGELRKALEVYKNALDNVLSEPIIASIKNRVGEVLFELGRSREARQEFQQAFEIDARVYGDDHPLVARDISNLGLVLKNEGKLQEAKNAFEMALKIDEKKLGPGHIKVAMDMNNLAGAMSDLGDTASAERYYRRALEIFTSKLGREHVRTRITEQNLCTLLLTKRGNNESYRQAEQVFQESFNIAQRTDFRESWSYLLANLGSMKGYRKDFSAAEHDFLQGLQLAKQMEQPERICDLLANLGALAIECKDYSQAEQYLKEGLTIASAREFQENKITLLANLGTLELRKGNYRKAKEYLNQGLNAARQKGYQEKISDLQSRLSST